MKAKDLGDIVKKTVIDTAIASTILYPIFSGIHSLLSQDSYVESLAKNWPFVMYFGVISLGRGYLKYKKAR